MLPRIGADERGSVLARRRAITESGRALGPVSAAKAVRVDPRQERGPTFASFGTGTSSTRSGAANRLHVEELVHAPAAQLAAVAGLLDAAEGEAWVGGDHAVDEDGAGVEVAG